MNILVTGGAGFIGSNFVHYMLSHYPEDKIVNLDLLTYAGNLHNLDDINDHPKHIFVQGNITDRKLVTHLIREHHITHIVNFAAETHVDRSILNPEIFVETNIQGTLALLNSAKEQKGIKFVQISTDEVYGSLDNEGYFTESTPLAPNSPYSASKAGADLLVRAYHKTYGLEVNITRCSNNYGPYQFPEKFIPLMITNGIDSKAFPIYGDGSNIRDWIHVNDHCSAIDLILRNGRKGEVYNIGGHNEYTNNEVAAMILEALGLSKQLITFVRDRLGHDKRYAIDSAKLQNELGWKPAYIFEAGIEDTIQWFLKNEIWWRPLKD